MTTCRHIIRIGTTAIMPSGVHDRGYRAVRMFNHACSCEVDHTRRSDIGGSFVHIRRAASKFLKRNMDRHHPRRTRAGSASNPSETRSDPRVEMSMKFPGRARTNWFWNERHAPQVAALSPSCPIAELRGSGSMTAQTLTDCWAPLDRDGETEFAMGRRPLSPWAPYPPRHAQPGIHEYTAQTLAGG